MRTKVNLVGRFLVGLVLVAAVSLATAEAMRGSGQVRNGCDECERDLWCEQCCDAAGSICLWDGQCLCN